MDFRKRIENLIRDKKFLITSHRGVWAGNIIQNTQESALLAVKSGANIVEIDVCISKDGDYFLFHDGHESDLLHKNDSLKEMTNEEILSAPVYNTLGVESGYKINRLEDFLEWIPESMVVNIDRSWLYFSDLKFMNMLKTSNKQSQFFLKSPVESLYLKNLALNGSEIPYMAIVTDEADYEILFEYQNKINLIGIEVVFKSINDPQLASKYLTHFQKSDDLIMFNAINLGKNHNLASGMIDDEAILENGENWKAILSMGANVIQTDWPYFCAKFRGELYD